MVYPCVVPKAYCKTAVHVTIHREGVSRHGAPLKALEFDFKCNYQDSAKTVLDNEKKLVQLSGIALFRGDICPELPIISGGSVTVFGVKRRIYQGTKARNPDGTVNYTELRLI